jgi:hypothetical protein|tara:strand:- start:9 stop:194 length:186 start_codon:yes stop_codon:yes gene_type:complete
MSENTLDTIGLDDLLFIIGGIIFQGETTDSMDIELLLKLQKLLDKKLEKLQTEIPEGTIIH